MSQPSRITILGAGFGGLELATLLSEAFGTNIDVTLIDGSDGFAFGFSKFEVLFGRSTVEQVTTSYRSITRPGVTFLQEKITGIDVHTRTVTTDVGAHEADYLVIALGADYDIAATPGLAENGGDFYSISGADRLRPRIADFTSGHVVIGVCGAPYKCPPAPSEAALLLHDTLVRRGVREHCTITFLCPFATPLPPSPDTSAALLEAFAERDIIFRPKLRIDAIDDGRKVAILDDGSECPFDLFLGVPRHQAPDVVIASGITVDGYVPVDGRTLRTAYPGVFAVGDVATVGTPKSGTYSERQARVAAAAIIADIRGETSAVRFDGMGQCYIEFGDRRVARVDIDFYAASGPNGSFVEPSAEMARDKEHFGSSRLERWFA